MARRYARCPECFTRQLIKIDGGIFKHTRGYSPNLSDRPICKGSGAAVTYR